MNSQTPNISETKSRIASKILDVCTEMEKGLSWFDNRRTISRKTLSKTEIDTDGTRGWKTLFGMDNSFSAPPPVSFDWCTDNRNIWASAVPKILDQLVGDFVKIQVKDIPHILHGRESLRPSGKTTTVQVHLLTISLSETPFSISDCEELKEQARSVSISTDRRAERDCQEIMEDANKPLTWKARVQATKYGFIIFSSELSDISDAAQVFHDCFLEMEYNYGVGRNRLLIVFPDITESYLSDKHQ